MPSQPLAHGDSGRRHEDADPVSHASITPQTSMSDVDDLLDEIDGLLEENAEAFVKSFIQKGGQ